MTISEAFTKATGLTIEEGIRKAQASGYKPGIHITPCEIEGIEMYHKGDTLLDPSFWQALGKACGWDGVICTICKYDHVKRNHPNGKHWCTGTGMNWIANDQAEYLYEQHRFIDALNETTL